MVKSNAWYMCIVWAKCEELMGYMHLTSCHSIHSTKITFIHTNHPITHNYESQREWRTETSHQLCGWYHTRLFTRTHWKHWVTFQSIHGSERNQKKNKKHTHRDTHSKSGLELSMWVQRQYHTIYTASLQLLASRFSDNKYIIYWPLSQKHWESLV